MSTHGNQPGGPDLRPLDKRPVSIYSPYTLARPITHDLEANRREFLAAVAAPLAGLPLGAHDLRIIAWLAKWDVPTVGAVASLMHRARAADPLPPVRPTGAPGSTR